MTQHPTPRYAYILGSHPELSFFELERTLPLLGVDSESLKRSGNIAFCHSTTTIDAQAQMERLGGTIKVVKIVGAFTEDALVDWLFDQVHTGSKFHYGFSLYNTQQPTAARDVRTLRTLGLRFKKIFKSEGISARFVEAREPTLSSVIVHKERLLKNGVDIVLIQTPDGMLFGKTLAVQPFQAFSKRDYGRPGRDFRSGMLPPKVARMMVNCAAPKPEDIILDPFCGSGTVLTEALLMGYTHVIGSDISSKAIQDTKQNIEWLKLPPVPLNVADVRNISAVLGKQSVDCIVAEGYLGPVQPRNPQQAHDQLMPLYTDAFAQMAQVLKPNGRIVFALPAWKNKDGTLLRFDLQSTFASLGLTPFHPPIIYGRPNATVVRDIQFLTHLS